MNVEYHSIFWNLQLFFQCLNIFILQAFRFLSWVYSVVCFLFFVLGYCEHCCLFDIFLTKFVICVQWDFRISCANFICCYFAECVYQSWFFGVVFSCFFFYKESLYALLISSSPDCILPYSSLVLLPQLRTHPFVVPGLSGDAEVFLWWLRDSALCLYPYPCQNFYCEGMLYFVKGIFGII